MTPKYPKLAMKVSHINIIIQNRMMYSRVLEHSRPYYIILYYIILYYIILYYIILYYIILYYIILYIIPYYSHINHLNNSGV